MGAAMNRLETQLADRLYRYVKEDRESSEIIAQTIRLMIDQAVSEMEAENTTPAVVVPNEELASSECPICGFDRPHSHSEWEMANVEALRGARRAFERAARDHLGASVFADARRGYWQAFPAEFVTDVQGAWAERSAPYGDYINPFVRQMWHFWRDAWLNARGADSASGDPRG